MKPKLKKSTARTNSYGKPSKKRAAQLPEARRQRNQTKETQSTCTQPETPITPQPSTSCQVEPALQTLPPQTQPTSILSASKRKLSYNITPAQATETPEAITKLPTTIMDLGNLLPLFTKPLCPVCKQPALALRSDSARNYGLAVHLELICTHCEQDISSTYTSGKQDSHIFDINRRAVAAACATGMGYAGLCNFSELMDIPSLHHKTFNSHSKVVKDKCDLFSREGLEKSVNCVRQAYSEQSEEIKNINVSFDGSWHKRGHTSKSGIGLVIEQRTGLIIDYEVLTSYCSLCATTGSKLQKTNILKYERWFAAHQSSCDANYEGPSGGMEKETAVRMWSCSVIQNKLRYVSLIGDGDAKTISEIHALNLYLGITVMKHECMNHVGKRLGTALRNLVKDKAKEKLKVTLGGKGFGKLRPETILKLQAYYTNAIRRNTTVPEMKQAILAITEHCSSTDESPQHNNCTIGPDSWCFFQRAISQGLEPGPHNENIRTPLSKEVANHIEPIFQRMASDDLLSRCTLNSTQNVNESAHSVIWARCPKHLFVNRNRLCICCAWCG